MVFHRAKPKHLILMSDATQRFTGRAAAYDRYRQRYPREDVLRLLRAWCGLQPDWLIADIGAGTGMLSEVFLENGNRVLAIEPNPEMRRACEHLLSHWPQLQVIDATAEATKLSNASVDIVSAGRAFHWFDTQPALAEFRRVLKPHGWVVLVALGRAHNGSEQAVAFESLLLERSNDHAYARSTYRIHDRLAELFPAELHHAELPIEQHLTWDSLQGQAQSLSVVPRATDPGYEAFHQALRRHFDTYSHDGILTMPTTCWVSAGRFNTQ